MDSFCLEKPGVFKSKIFKRLLTPPSTAAASATEPGATAVGVVVEVGRPLLAPPPLL